MKYWFLAGICSLIMSGVAAQGYQINVTLKPYKNQKVYLAYHYGDIKGLADSAVLNTESKGAFTGKTPLPGGIYMLVSPQKVILFELLIDKQQRFGIIADTADLKKLSFTGSPDNTAFQAYQRFTEEKGRQINMLQTGFSGLPAEKQATTKNEISALSKEIDAYRQNYRTKNPTGILTALFNALRDPVIPPAERHPGGKYDSLYAFQYYKSHFWDGVSFADDRLVRTPFFKPKMKKYFEQLVSPDPDSLILETDKMLRQATGSKEMFNFLLSNFIDKYINPEYMGQDKVFLFLFEKYINAGKAEWLSEKQRKYINDRAYSLMANQLGAPAPVLDLVDTSGKKRPLYDIKAPFTVVCFWDATCGHCKEVAPKLDSMYRSKWKSMGVALYGVMVDGGVPAWKNFITEHHFTDWTHVYQTDEDRQADSDANRPNFRQLYDVFQTPVLYLLDENKRIIAKKITYEQVDKLIELKLQKQ